jgi:hypothetical protein
VSAASYCSLKVTKVPASFKIEAKYAKLSFLQHWSSEKNRPRWKKYDVLEFYFFSGSPTYPVVVGSVDKLNYL